MLRIIAVTSNLLMVAFASGKPDERAIRAAIERLFPKMLCAGLKLYRTAVPNFFRAEVGNEVFHVTADGKHLLFGEAPQVAFSQTELIGSEVPKTDRNSSFSPL